MTKTEPDVPRTAAHALHALLAKVVSHPHAAGLHAPWAEALGVEAGSAEFAKRHGEVVDLFNRTVEQIAMLPSRTIANYEKWVPAWWRAVISPDLNWNQQLSASIIEDVHLSLLHTLGDVVEAKFGGTPLAPRGGFILELRQAVEDCLDELQTDATILPNDALRLSLIESLKHILWLIEHRDVFGDASIAQAAQQAIGAVALAAPHVPKDKRTSWKKRAVALAGVIAIFNGIVGGTQTAIESTGTAVVAAIDAGESIVGELQGE